MDKLVDDVLRPGEIAEHTMRVAVAARACVIGVSDSEPSAVHGSCYLRLANERKGIWRFVCAHLELQPQEAIDYLTSLSVKWGVSFRMIGFVTARSDADSIRSVMSGALP